MNKLEKKGSSETTREAFCFDLYIKYKPLHIKKVNKRFLQWFIGFSEGDCTFHSWFDGQRKRAGFSIDQKDPKVLYVIRKQLGFGRILPCKKYWRFQVWDKDNLHRLYCLFAGNIVLDKRHLRFQKWTTFLSFPVNFSIPSSYSLRLLANTFGGTGAINLDNAWLAGFWQADGGFYAVMNPTRINVILRAYITQLGEIPALDEIALQLSGGKKAFSFITNNRSETFYNRVDFASQHCLEKILSYLEEYKLYGEKRLNFLRWKRVYEMREKLKSLKTDSNQISDLLSEKSIKKLKRLIAATKTTK